jgi:tRNA pseudouridine32 synthase/23S rRNA pseudouridine746 synthase
MRFPLNVKRKTGTMQTRFDITIDHSDPAVACDALTRRTKLSKSKVKQAMIKGAVWLQRPGDRSRRIRRATMIVHIGDRLRFYHDPAILELRPPAAHCLLDHSQYSIWFKPAGLMTQGTRFGDHCALSRQVEHHFGGKRKVYVVHRLDREANGLLILAHARSAAAYLSRMLRNHAIEKGYRICVRGDLSHFQRSGHIDFILDEKAAHTEYEMIRYLEETDQTLVRVRLRTGRLHQIRRHMDMIGFPVIGDPRYGQNNKNTAGLQLVADSLAFDCPFGKGWVAVTIDPEGIQPS